MRLHHRTVVFGLATLIAGAVVLASPGRSLAQGIDELFSRYKLEYEGKSYVEAERTTRQMIQASTSQSWLAVSYNSLGRCLNAQERYDEAIAAYQTALRYPLDAGNVNRGWIPNNLGNVYRSQKKLDEAERFYKQALTEFYRMDGANSATVATVRSNLGWVYHDQKKYDQSVNEHYEALRIRREVFGSDSTEAGTSLNGLGSAYTDGGRLEEGRVELEKALAIKEATDGPQSHDAAVVLNNLAENASLQKQHEKADRYVRRALAIRESLYGKNSSHASRTLESLAKYQEKAGKTDEAGATRLQISQMKQALARGGVSPDNPFSVGQKIQVTAAEAHVMAAGQPIGAVRKGMEFKVTHVNGRWCGVQILVGGEKKSGWLDSSQATLPP